MRRALSHIIPLFILLATAGCSRRASVIPETTMSDIYYDMFCIDQWIQDNSDMKKAADTTLVYEPIFNRYGYTTEDYDASVSYYLARPEKLVKITERTAKRFEKETERLGKLREEISAAEIANRIYEHYVTRNFGEDSVKWAFGEMKGVIDSILTENKWIIIQESTDTLQTTQSVTQ